MSALLSPPKPVRSRFRVPGEGCYELAADLLPAPSRMSMPTSATVSVAPQGSSKTANMQSGTHSSFNSSSTAALAGPLGLPSVTKVTIARKAQLADSSFSSLHVTSSPLANSASKESSQSSVMFSFRKLSGLGTFAGLSGKLAGASGAGSGEETMLNSSPPLGAPMLSSTAAAGSTAPSIPAATRQRQSASSLSANRSSNSSNPLSPYPQSPPSAVTSVSISTPSSGSSQILASSPNLRANSPISVGRLSESNGPHQQIGAAPAPSGVLAYNFADSVVVLDLATHASFSTSTASDASITLKLRSQPTSHALASYGDKLRLVVGCINGEVAYWEDIGVAHARESSNTSSRKSRTTSTSLSNVASGAGTSGASMSQTSNALSSSQAVFNKDGYLNSKRVVAIRWLPGPGFRFIAVHVDGALIIYDTRLKKAATTAAPAAAAPQETQASQGTMPAPGPAPSLAQLDSAAFRTGASLNGATPQNGAACAAVPTGNGSGSNSVSSGRSNSRGDEFQNHVNGASSSEREKNVASDKSTPSIERVSSSSAPGHRRSNSLASPGPIGQHEIVVLKPSRGKRVNPVMIWQVGRGPVADAAFAPGNGASGEQLLLAIASRDGYLRILDITRETMVVAFRSYFGAFLCTSWSPDGKYVAAGGEDDLVSIWCPAEERIVARCEGHTSWVSSVAWDATLCGRGRYRLGSAGQDAKLLLWDFSLDMLVTRFTSSQRTSLKEHGNVRNFADGLPINYSDCEKSTTSSGLTNTLNGCLDDSSVLNGLPHVATVAAPPAFAGTYTPSQDTNGKGGSAAHTQAAAYMPSASFASERKPGKLARLRNHAAGSMGSRDELEISQLPSSTGVIVPALGRAAVPIIEPVLTHVAHVEPLTDVYFLDTGIVTADCVGNVKLWMRPPQEHVPPLVLDRTNDHDTALDPTDRYTTESALQRPADLD